MSYPDHLAPGIAELDLQEHLEVTLLRIAGLRLGPWRHADLHAPYWRLYCNKCDGAHIVPLGSAPMPLHARCRYLIPPWVHFASDSRDGVEHIFCHFDIVGMPGALIRQWFAAPLRLRGDAIAENALIALGDAVAGGAPITPGVVCAWKAAIHGALSDVLDGLPRDAHARLLRHTRGDLPLRRALERIHADLGGDLSNAVLAGRSGITTDHLIRLFRRHLGQTPVHYVQERRLASAARELMHGEDGIDAIAERHGFANRFYFSRVFTRRMGLAPAAWRRRHRESAGRREG